MQKNINIPSNLIEELSKALIENIGLNAPYPTPEEIVAHKLRAARSLKYRDLVFTNDTKPSTKGIS